MISCAPFVFIGVGVAGAIVGMVLIGLARTPAVPEDKS